MVVERGGADEIAEMWVVGGGVGEKGRAVGGGAGKKGGAVVK